MPIAVPERATQEQIENHLEFLTATLPSKAIDSETGKNRLAVYSSVLLGCGIDALKFMARRVVETHKWFPTPKECLDILADYHAPETERAATLRLCQAFADDAFEVWLDNVKGGDPIGDVPGAWCRIAVERGVVRRLDDGSYVSRARFIGPTLEGKVMPWLSRGTWHSEVNKDRNGREESPCVSRDDVTEMTT